VRFEILDRDGLARTGELEVDGVAHRTPTMAFVDTWRHPAPKGCLKLRQSSLAKEGDISIAPSGFSKSACDGNCHIDVGHRGSPFAEERKDGCFVVPENISELMLNSRAFAEAVDGIKSGASLLKPAICPVAGLPSRLAMLAYCGMDLFDSIPLIMATENGLYLTTSGAIHLDSIGDLPCGCATCNEGIGDKEGLLRHNISVAESELRLIRHQISQGRLRELVESRIRSEPWQIQSLRLLDLEHGPLQEMHAPIKGAKFVAGSKESLLRPDVARWRSRLVDRYRRPEMARILVLIPCSARKPYSTSSSHRRFREAIWNSGNAHAVHEVIVTSPLGLVPRELELFYPAQDYDIPVTGHWDRDERKMVEDMIRWQVESQGYDMVISHLGDERDIVHDVISDFIDTSDGRPGSGASLRKLEETLREQLPDDDAKPSWRSRAAEDMRAISMFQFGEAGSALTDDVRVRGRWPEMKIFGGDVQRGAMSSHRGMISLTLAGAESIASRDAYCVHIEDFTPKGNLFAVGVEDATDDFRIGDDVVIRHGKDIKAVGVARMTPVEMRTANRGEAVHVRHCVK
jgi:archaeosine synthase alpha-subunit